MEQMKIEVQATEAELNTLREAIANQEKLLTNPTPTSPKPGSDDFKKFEADIIQKKANFNALASVKKKELMEKETKVYYLVYKEIADEVAALARQYNISMVLRYNSDALDVPPGTAPGREDVAKLMSKPIIYLGPDLDITARILTTINSRYPQPAPGGSAKALGPTRPAANPLQR